MLRFIVSKNSDQLQNGTLRPLPLKRASTFSTSNFKKSPLANLQNYPSTKKRRFSDASIFFLKSTLLMQCLQGHQNIK